MTLSFACDIFWNFYHCSDLMMVDHIILSPGLSAPAPAGRLLPGGGGRQPQSTLGNQDVVTTRQEPETFRRGKTQKHIVSQRMSGKKLIL